MSMNPKEWHINTVQVIIYYPNYFDLIPDKEQLLQVIKETELTKKFPEPEILPPPQVAGVVPVIDVRFFRDKEQRIIPFMQVLIDPTTVRFLILGLKQNPTEFLENDELSQYLNLVAEFWKKFDEVASRKIIQRLGLVIEFSNENKSVLDYLRGKLLKHSIHQVFELRFSNFLNNLPPFKNTTVVPNLFISPTIAPRDKELTDLEVKQVRLISDIATTPSSKGVIEPEDLEKGLLTMLELSKEQIDKFWRVVSE